ANDAAIAPLRQIVSLLRQNNVFSVLPLVIHPPTGTDEVLLLASVTTLPHAAITPAERRPIGFRWYTIPLLPDLPNASIDALGSRSTFKAPTAGLWAVVVLGYARQGLTDPYEFRVDLPDGARINFLQYEFLMNILERSFTLGVEINTFR